MERRIYKNAVEGVTPSRMRLYAASRFFWDVGLPAIEKEFPAYVDRAAAGCFAASSDCGQLIGFQIYLTQDDYDNIGSSVQLLLDSLPKDYDNMHFEQVGRVFSIDSFYLDMTAGRFKSAPVLAGDWLSIPEYRLFDLAQGQVFYDPIGDFTERRKGFMAYYPEDAWRFKLCRSLYEFGYCGQVMLPDALSEADYFTAELAWWRFAGAAMRLGFHLVREYSPDERRLYKEFSRLAEFSPSVVNLLWNGQCDVGSRPMIVEEMASVYKGIIVKLGLLSCSMIENAGSFVDLARGIAEGISDCYIRDAAVRLEGDFV